MSDHQLLFAALKDSGCTFQIFKVGCWEFILILIPADTVLYCSPVLYDCPMVVQINNYYDLRSLLTYRPLYLNCCLPLFDSVGKRCITFK